MTRTVAPRPASHSTRRAGTHRPCRSRVRRIARRIGFGLLGFFGLMMIIGLVNPQPSSSSARQPVPASFVTLPPANPDGYEGHCMPVDVPFGTPAAPGTRLLILPENTRALLPIDCRQPSPPAGVPTPAWDARRNCEYVPTDGYQPVTIVAMRAAGFTAAPGPVSALNPPGC